MIEAVSCGGVVIYKWKILLLYKNQNGRYMGWVLPKDGFARGKGRKRGKWRDYQICRQDPIYL